MALAAKRAAEDLALKMGLEIKLAKSMQSFFKEAAKEIRTYYIAKHQILDPRVFDTEINYLLRTHYKKVARKFDSHLRADLRKCLRQPETKALDDLVKQKTTEFLRRRSIEQTAFIAATNAKEVTESFNRVVISAAVSGKNISDKEIATQAAALFELRGQGRARTIGQTETQYAAEKTKDIEALALLEDDVIADGVVLRPENLTKTWSTILDSHTREEHALADDQTVQQDQPFKVWGDFLMFPGDDALGAKLENIINCRCNTSRAIELTELPDFVVHPANQAPRRGNLFFPTRNLFDE